VQVARVDIQQTGGLRPVLAAGLQRPDDGLALGSIDGVAQRQHLVGDYRLIGYLSRDRTDSMAVQVQQIGLQRQDLAARRATEEQGKRRAADHMPQLAKGARAEIGK